MNGMHNQVSIWNRVAIMYQRKMLQLKLQNFNLQNIVGFITISAGGQVC